MQLKSTSMLSFRYIGDAIGPSRHFLERKWKKKLGYTGRSNCEHASVGKQMNDRTVWNLPRNISKGRT
jgi:hypothetical protein